MKLVLYILFLFLAENLMAQDLKYAIRFPPGGRLGVTDLPDSIDTKHFYTHREIKDLAEPASGWTMFYKKVDSLDYPQKAKEQKLQSSMTVEFRINETGLVDSVFIKSFQNKGRWTKCEACETLIIDYFKNAKWIPGRIGDVAVKTVDYAYVEFRIFDPNSKEPFSPFGY